MKVKGTIDNVKHAGEDRVRVAFTLTDSAISGNFSKLMTAAEAKKAGFFPGDECEISLEITSLHAPPEAKVIARSP